MGKVPVGKENDKYRKSHGVHLKRELLLALALCIVLLPGMVLQAFGLKNEFTEILAGRWFRLIPATLAQLLIGRRFWGNAWRSLRAGVVSFDMLAALGSAAAYMLGVCNHFVFEGGADGPLDGLHFELSTIVIAAMAFGRLLAYGAECKTSGSAAAHVGKTAYSIAAIYVTVTITGALLTALGWWFHSGDYRQAFDCLAAVLAVSCPCAAALAVPVAVRAGTANGAAHGIAIRDGNKLENAARLTAVMWGKSGIITSGSYTVTNILSVGGANAAEALELAGIAEKRSLHPLGAAIYSYVKRRMGELPDPDTFAIVEGRGIRAEIEGKQVLIGSRRLLLESGVPLGGGPEVSARLEDEGKTAVLVAIDGVLSTVIAIADTVRESAPEAIAQLDGMGIRSYLVSGDSRRTCAAAGAKVGIGGERVYAELLPAEKVQEVGSLQAMGHVVALAGDIVHDQYALAAADVGFAPGDTGPDTAAAGITLMSGDLRLVPTAIRLSRRTLRKIKQNLFCGVIFNLIGIPLAALGLVHPVAAVVAAMALSCASMVVNGAGLRRFDPTQ